MPVTERSRVVRRDGDLVAREPLFTLDARLFGQVKPSPLTGCAAPARALRNCLAPANR